jgi:uncharacterized protein (TIGR03435 family)
MCIKAIAFTTGMLLMVLGSRESALGQTSGAPVAFEAASVKVSSPVPGQNGQMAGGPGTADPGRITFSRVPLAQLLMRAYDVKFSQLSGPKWIGDYSVVFDLTATLPPNTSTQQFQSMLRNLLAERFHLILHHETKARPGYQLVVANGGPKFKESSPDTTSPSPAYTGATRVGRDGNVEMPGPGMFMTYWNGAQRTGYRERTMEQFALSLGSLVNMSNGAEAGAPVPVVADKTGLTGKYDFSLNFACMYCGGIPPRPAAGPDALATAGDPDDAPNIFIAIEKQLGLKLEKTKDVPVDVLVIDSTDKAPTEN